MPSTINSCGDADVAGIVSEEKPLSSAADLSLPEDLLWRPAYSEATAATGKKLCQKPMLGGIDYLYLVMTIVSAAVCVGRLMWCGG